MLCFNSYLFIFSGQVRNGSDECIFFLKQTVGRPNAGCSRRFARVSQSEAFAGRAADLTNRDMVIIEGVNDKFTVDGATAPKLIAKRLRRRLNTQAHLADPIFDR